MLVLGGGGYTIRNVARCWCYETACCCNVELPDQVSCQSQLLSSGTREKKYIPAFP
jgi:hypothetical protein